MTAEEIDALIMALPGAERSTAYGQPCWRIAGKFLTRLRSEDDSLALDVGSIERRDMLVEIEPALRRRPGASFAAAMLFFGTINWTHTWFNPKGPVSAGALAEMAVDLTLGGVRKAAE